MAGFGWESNYYKKLEDIDVAQTILDKGLVNKDYQKMINTTRSAEEKMQILEERGLKKQLDVTGYQDGIIDIYSFDGDSGNFIDPTTGQTMIDPMTGKSIQFRLASSNHFDIIDKESARQNSNYKSRIQPPAVSRLVGKPIEELTEDDFINVANYQQQQMYSSLNDKDYKFTAYDRNTLYIPIEQSNIDMSYKVVGKDDYGRLLIDAVNPNTGRSVAFDASNNPYLNTSFDLYKSLDTEKNRQQMNNFYNNNDVDMRRLVDVFDTDGRIRENLDIIKSSAYSTAARALQYGPEFLVDKEKWKKIANPVTGQALADAWAGVKLSTREGFQNEMQNAAQAWENGDVIGAIIGIVGQMDRVLSESAVQMALITAGTVATGGIASAAGITASIASRAAIAMIGAMPAGLDKTLMTIEDYKLNNNGRMMSEGELAEAFAINTLTLIPETFLLGINFTRILPKPVSRAFSPVYQSSKPITAGKVFLHSAGLETLQEGLETATENWLSQNQDNPETLLSYLTSSETQFGALTGMLMGMTISGSGIAIKAPFQLGSARSQARYLDRIQNDSQNLTTLGTKADTDISNSVLTSISNIPTQYNTIEDVNQAVDNLVLLGGTANINTNTVDAIEQKKVEIVSNYLKQNKDNIKNNDSLLKALGISKEKAFEEQVYYSDYNGSKQFSKTGKNLTAESKEEVKQDLIETAQALGINKKEAEAIIKKTIEEVSFDTANGPIGYNTISDKINSINKVLTNTSGIDSNQQTALENTRKGYVNQLVRLHTLQSESLVDFANHAEIIKNEKRRDVPIKFNTSKRSFTLKGRQLASNTFESGIGAYGVVQRIYNDTKNIETIVKNLPNSVTKNLVSELVQINAMTDVADTSLRLFKEASTSIRNNVMNTINKIDSTTSERVTQPITNNEAVGMLKRLVKPNTTSAVELKFKTKLRTITKEQAQKIKDELNKEQKYSDEVKTELITKLNEVLELEETTVKETAKEIERVANEKQKAELMQTALNEVVVDEITLQNAEVFESLLSNARNSIKALIRVKDTEALIKDLKEKESAIRLKLNELTAQESIDKVTEKTSEQQTEESTINERYVEQEYQEIYDEDIIDTINYFDKIQTDLKVEIEQVIEGTVTIKTISKLLDKVKTIGNEISKAIPFHIELLDDNQALIEILLDKRIPLLKSNELVKDRIDKRLEKELIVSNNPDSKIAITGATKEYVTKVLSKFKSKLLSKKPMTLKYWETLNDVDKTGWSFIYDINIDTTTINPKTGKLYNHVVFTHKDNVTAAIDLSLREYFAQSNTDEMFNPYTYQDENLSAMYDIKEEELTNEVRKNIRETITEHGLPRTFFVSRIGDIILANLGIKINKEGTYKYYEKVSATLGLHALEYGEALGYIQTSQAQPIKGVISSQAISKEKTVPYIKVNEKVDIISEYTKGTFDKQGNQIVPSLKEQYKISDTVKTMPSNSYIHSPKNEKQRHTFMDVPSEQKYVLKKLRRTPYVMNVGLADLALKNIDKLKERLGFTSNIDNTVFAINDRLSREGVNISVNRELDALKDMTELQRVAPDEGWFFDWFISKNGRFFIESNYVNPQTGKSLQRFLMLPKKMHIEFDSNNDSHMNAMYFIIAQAFDAVKSENDIKAIGQALDTLTKEQTEQLQQDIFDLTEEQFEHKYAHLGIRGIENIGQALLVTQHLLEKKKANGQPFKTWLAAENDSTTSGYYIKMLQFPNDSLLENYGPKVGINIDTEIHSKKTEEHFLDIYQTSAFNAISKLPVDMITSKIGKTNLPIDNLNSVYLSMKDALPNVEIITNDKTKETKVKVTSKLRKLFKNPTMIFGYSAGEAAIKRKVANDITEDFINTYVEIKKEGGLDSYLKNHPNADIKSMTAIFKTLEKFNNNLLINDNLYQQLQVNSLDKILIKFGNRNTNLQEVLSQVLESTYGQAVWDSLSESFSHFKEYNTTMIQMFNSMFKKFNTIYKQRVESKINVDGEISIADHQEIINDLYSIMPIMPLAYAGNLSEGMLLMDTKKERNINNSVKSYFYEQGSNNYTSSTTTADVRQFTDAGLAGGVIPIHFIDGMIMTLMMNKYPNTIPVHDAIVMSFLDNIKITSDYNRKSFLLNKEYDVYGTLYESYLNVLNNYEKLGGVLTDEDNDFSNKVKDLAIANAEARDKFYAEDRTVSNMDGIQGTQVFIHKYETIYDSEFKDGLGDLVKQSNYLKQYSDVNEYKTNGDTRYLLQQANESVEGRVNVFDSLQSLAKNQDNIIENEEHVNYLKDLVRKINIEHTRDLIVEYSTSQDFNVSMLDGNHVVIGFDNKTVDLDPMTSLSAYSGKSPAEMYAHELVHAATRMGFANKTTLKLNGVINQLLNVQKEAMKYITWEHFMPVKYDPNMQTVYENYAKKTWDYIFKNKNQVDKENLKSLQEFVAHGTTNKKIMDILKDHKILSKINTTNMNLLDKLIALTKTVLDVVFGSKKFHEGFATLHEVLKGNLPFNQRRTLFTELEKLTNKVMNSNIKQSAKLYQHPLKIIEMAFRLLGVVRTVGNYILSPIIKFVLDIGDTRINTLMHVRKILGNQQGQVALKGQLQLQGTWHTSIAGSLFDSTRMLVSILAKAPFSQVARRSMRDWLQNVVKLNQQGPFLSILRDVTGPDSQTSALHMISALTRSLESTSMDLKNNVYNEILHRFGVKSFNEVQSTALNKAILMTDIQSLFNINSTNNTTNIDEVVEYLNNPQKVIDDIKRLDNEIKIEAKDTLKEIGQSEWFYSQALGLALFMTSGKGNYSQNLNARQIAKGTLSGKQITTTVSESTITKIDKLATLLALQMTDSNLKQTVVSLNKEGLDHYLRMHQQYVKESYEGINIINQQGQQETVDTINDFHIIKGYTKQLYDSTVDIKWDSVDNKVALGKASYSLIHTLADNDITGQTKMAIYRRTFAPQQRRDGSSVIIQRASSIGTTLKDVAYSLLQNTALNTSQDINTLKNVYNDRANIEAKKLQQVMLTRRMTPELFQKYSSGYTPIINQHGEIADFRITMSQEVKEKVLNINNSGPAILSTMYASGNMKAHASMRNNVVLEFLKDDMKNNMHSGTFTNDLGNNYIKFDKNSNNKYLKDSWKVVPKEFIEYIKHNELYVREDWLRDLFGTPTFSLAETQFVEKHTGPIVKRSILIGEAILKAIAQMAKQNYIIRIPAILIGNIMSNFNYNLMSNGVSPVTTLKKNIDNTRAIRDYLDTKKELNKLKFRDRIGTITEQERNSISWYETKLQNNIVQPLMEKGMYQAIVEELNAKDLESVGRINKLIRDNKFVKKIPSPIRWMTKQLYMAEGTPIYDFIFITTQYSDFVARATEYQFKMEHAPEKYENYIDKTTGKEMQRLTDKYIDYEAKTSADVWNAFINYDKPQSTLEQYLNDIGILMFTKFFKNIQHVITKNLVDNPMGVLLFLTGQSFFSTGENILEQNIFNKYYSSIFHNPLKEFINAVVPMPIQVWAGMRKRWLRP